MLIQNRRNFLSALGVLSTSALFANELLEADSVANNFPIASNQYPWFTFYERSGQNWSKDLDSSLNEFQQSGIKGYEPLINNAAELKAMLPLIKKHNLKLNSLYINSTLHDADEADKSINQALEIARLASQAGVKIMVTNPSPIKWGTMDDKTDEQLIFQAKALDKLGEELRKLGITLAYHTHDSEMRNSAREFHHMLQATNPKNVSLCLDAHWVYRGSANSEVALFDIVKMYGKRITELHLRQSHNGVWGEVFSTGDIDYRRLTKELSDIKIKPHLVLEQCVESKSPNTLNAIEAHVKSLKYTREVCALLM